MYEIKITRQSEGSTVDFVNTFKGVVRFVARETGMTQREVREELQAQQDSKFNRDNLGFRVQVGYTKYA